MVNADFHRLHLKALIQRERDVAYQRQCYLSDGWRAGLPSREGGTMRGADAATNTTAMPSRSPTSLDEAPTTRIPLGSPQTVMTPPSTFSIYSPSYVVGGAEAMSEKIGIRQRDRIIEWMYQVVDRLGEQISFPYTFYLAYIGRICLYNGLMIVHSQMMQILSEKLSASRPSTLINTSPRPTSTM